ncbi:MAG: Hsp20/alpha crystallin family protein [Spongiibacteraceae bacterium]
MNFQKLNPWNWFKHEDNGVDQGSQIPVRRGEASRIVPSPTNTDWQREQHPVQQLHQQIDRLFDNVFSNFGLPSLNSPFQRQLGSNIRPTEFYRPQVDVSGDDNQYEIALDVPGLSEGDLSIEVKGDVLTIRGEKEEKHEHKDKQFYRVERSYGSFQRTLSLPVDANADDIQANLKAGVLTLTIPRSQSEQDDVKRIAISSN